MILDIYGNTITYCHKIKILSFGVYHILLFLLTLEVEPSGDVPLKIKVQLPVKILIYSLKNHDPLFFSK